MPSGEQITAAIYIGAYTNQMILGHYNPESDDLDVRNEYTSYTKAINGSSIEPDALERIFHALHEMRMIAEREGVSEFRIAAASSLRNIENRSQVLIGCRKEFGVYPQIFSGRDEARLNFIGAVSGILSTLPVAMLFLGYHRTLFACGTGKKISEICELDFGVRNINEKFSPDRNCIPFFMLPFFRKYLSEKLGRVSEICNFWKKDLDLTPQFVCVGPLAQSVYTLIEQAHTFTRTMSDCPLSRDFLKNLFYRIRSMNQGERLQLPGMDPSAVESIVGGTSILGYMLNACNFEDFRVSAYGLCAGLLKTPPGLLATVKTSPQSGIFLPSRI